MIVPAKLRLDDDGSEVEFDAAAYFQEALPEEIEELRACGWGGDYPADQVAEFFEGVDYEVTQMLRHCWLTHSQDVNKGGFEVYIDGKAAEAYLAERGEPGMAVGGTGI